MQLYRTKIVSSQNHFFCTQSNCQCTTHTHGISTQRIMTQQILSAHSSMVLQQVVLQYTRGSGATHNKCHFLYMHNHFLSWGKRVVGVFTKKNHPIISCFTSYMPIFQSNCIPWSQKFDLFLLKYKTWNRKRQFTFKTDGWKIRTKYLSIPPQEHTFLIKTISGQQVTITSAAQPMLYSPTNAVQHRILYLVCTLHENKVSMSL